MKPAAFLALALLTPAALAQPPAFDVVSVRRHPIAADRRGPDATRTTIDPAMVNMTVASVAELMQFAYDCRSLQQIAGVLSALEREFYDVVARSTAGADTARQRHRCPWALALTSVLNSLRASQRDRRQ